MGSLGRSVAPFLFLSARFPYKPYKVANPRKRVLLSDYGYWAAKELGLMEMSMATSIWYGHVEQKYRSRCCSIC